MEELLTKLKEAAEIKCTIAKQESALWLKISEALNSYLNYQQKLKEQRKGLPVSNKLIHAHAYMNTTQAAEYLGLKYGTLAGWRFHGVGPKYVKMGGAIRYKIEDLDDFAAKNMPALTPPYPKRK